jgi:hypothetical protein
MPPAPPKFPVFWIQAKRQTIFFLYLVKAEKGFFRTRVAPEAGGKLGIGSRLLVARAGTRRLSENLQMDGQILLGILTDGFDQLLGFDQQFAGMVVNRRVLQQFPDGALA